MSSRFRCTTTPMVIIVATVTSVVMGISAIAQDAQRGGGAGSVEGRTLLPLEQGQRPMIIIDGEDSGERATLTLQRVSEGEPRWALRFEGYNTIYLVEINHSISLDLADLTLRLEAGYEPGRGMVYRRVRYTIEKLGLFGDTTTRTAVLAAE